MSQKECNFLTTFFEIFWLFPGRVLPVQEHRMTGLADLPQVAVGLYPKCAGSGFCLSLNKKRYCFRNTSLHLAKKARTRMLQWRPRKIRHTGPGKWNGITKCVRATESCRTFATVVNEKKSFVGSMFMKQISIEISPQIDTFAFVTVLAFLFDFVLCCWMPVF